MLDKSYILSLFFLNSFNKFNNSLLNVLISLQKTKNAQKSCILSLFLNSFNKFNKTREHM